jgi:hypothetical protein
MASGDVPALSQSHAEEGGRQKICGQLKNILPQCRKLEIAVLETARLNGFTARLSMAGIPADIAMAAIG